MADGSPVHHLHSCEDLSGCAGCGMRMSLNGYGGSMRITTLCTSVTLPLVSVSASDVRSPTQYAIKLAPAHDAH